MAKSTNGQGPSETDGGKRQPLNSKSSRLAKDEDISATLAFIQRQWREASVASREAHKPSR